MRQAAETKKEMRQINSSVTVMLHDRRGESGGLEPFFGLEIVEVASDRGFSLGANAFFSRPSLSRNLTGKPAITESRSRYRRASLPRSKLCLAEAHLARSAFCVFSDVFATALVADASRAKAGNQQIPHSLTPRLRDGVPSRMPTQQRAPRGLEAHTLNNVVARHPVACGPETHCRGAAVGHQT